MSKKDQIIEEIRKIYDPELPVNIYELGLIYDIQVENEKSAKIKMTLTTPNCPVAESLPKEVKEGAMQVEGIEEVDLTPEEETQKQADTERFKAEAIAENNAKAEKENLKASAKAKLIAGEALTQEEADTIVL